jgi:phosphatidylserine decarboxylase
MRLFARGFAVDVDEAEQPLAGYRTFEEFFTRRLKAGARPVAGGERAAVSPVDAVVAAVGLSEGGSLVQCKGRDYTLAALLDDLGDARLFAGGAYLTLYLAPRDYHRIHAPLAGAIDGYRYIPGHLFPVNGMAVRAVPNLFCVNERLITFLSTPLGRVAVVKVGATCVGRIRAAYDDVVTNAGRGPKRWRYAQPIPIEKGAELGVFEMGSTVILLFEPGRIRLGSGLWGARVRMGQAIAEGA